MMGVRSFLQRRRQLDALFVVFDLSLQSPAKVSLLYLNYAAVLVASVNEIDDCNCQGARTLLEVGTIHDVMISRYRTQQDLNLQPLACEPRDFAYSGRGTMRGTSVSARCLFSAVTG